jgi:hypothetical protein
VAAKPASRQHSSSPEPGLPLTTAEEPARRASHRAQCHERPKCVTDSVFAVRRASLVAAVAAALLSASACSPAPVCACPAPQLPFKLTFTTTIKGRTASTTAYERPPHFDVRSGRLLVIDVVVTVPKRARVSALWLGISTGLIGYSQKSRRPLLHPILAHPRGVLTAGSHSFRLNWRVPAKVRRGRRVYLVANWATLQAQTSSVAEYVASLVVRRARRS